VVAVSFFLRSNAHLARGNVSRLGVHSETAHHGTRLASWLVLEIETVCVTGPAEGKSPAARRGQIDERGAGSTLDVRLNGRTEWLRSIHSLRRDS